MTKNKYKKLHGVVSGYTSISGSSLMAMSLSGKSGSITSKCHYTTVFSGSGNYSYFWSKSFSWSRSGYTYTYTFIK